MKENPGINLRQYLLMAIGLTSTTFCFLFMLSHLSYNHAEVTSHAQMLTRNGGCYLNNLWCAKSVDVPSLANISQSLWGSYRPGVYFGMKSKAVDHSIGTGIMWSSSLAKQFRDQTSQDELTSFEWVRHDGKSFGTQRLVDSSYGMEINASFAIPDLSATNIINRMNRVPTWSQKIVIGSTKKSSGDAVNAEDVIDDERKSLIFYLGSELKNTNIFKDVKATLHKGSISRGYDHAMSLVGHSDALGGWFCLFVMAVQLPEEGDIKLELEAASKQKLLALNSSFISGEVVQSLRALTPISAYSAHVPSVISYVGLNGADLLSGVERIKQEAKIHSFGGGGTNNNNRVNNRHKETVVRLFDDFGEFINDISADSNNNGNPNDVSNFVAAQVSFSGSVRIDAILYDHLSFGEGGINNSDGLTVVIEGSDLHNWIEQAEARGADNVLPFTIVSKDLTTTTTVDAVVEVNGIISSATDVVTDNSKIRSEVLLNSSDSSSGLQITEEEDCSHSSSSSSSKDTTTAATTDVTASTCNSREGALMTTNNGRSLAAATAATAVDSMGQCTRDDTDRWIHWYSTRFDTQFGTVLLQCVDDTATDMNKVRNMTTAAATTAGTEASSSTASSTASLDNTVQSTRSSFTDIDNVKIDDTVYFTAQEIEAARVCLSSLLGGMGYFRGHPLIREVAADNLEETDNEQNVQDSSSISEKRAAELMAAAGLLKAHQPPISLFSATPSRTSFPRGFLWDEGFHQLVISQWDSTITLQVLASWMQAQHFPCGDHYNNNNHDGENAAASGNGGNEDDGSEMNKIGKCVGGWIPREMILGEEATRRVPDEFIAQRVNIANPPTLLLVVDDLITRYTGAPSLSVSLKEKSSALTRASQELVKGSQDLVTTTSSTVSTESAAVLKVLRDLYPQLHRWMQWFLHTQRGASNSYPGSFRWRGRSSSDGKVIPNTLASGLDDYPRAPVPSLQEHHVDLHCWMIMATGVLARLETALQQAGYPLSATSKKLADAAKYAEKHSYLLQRLDELHWSEKYKGYFDVGMNSEEADSHFSQEILFRCSNPRVVGSYVDVMVSIDLLRQQQHKDKTAFNDQDNFCPPSHPQPVQPVMDHHTGSYHVLERFIMGKNASFNHIPRIGYVSIFPLLLKLLDAESPRLSHVLDMIEDPAMLWTPYGLRSIAKSDRYYQRRNAGGDAPYWRGPIWIPINYLALSALRHYGATVPRAQRLYSQLRRNILHTVLGQYNSTGFFWEQYDDRTGAGMRGHPFTGWTALIVNIMAEKY